MTAVERAFLSKIGDLPSTCVFRGQADSRWRLHSAATRRLINYFDNDESVIEKAVFSDMHWVYHRSVLLEPARNYGFGSANGHKIPDIQLLAKLHGFGAATGFLDFSLDPLAALWYACEEDDCDGRVFVLDLDSGIGFRQISVGEAVQSAEDVFRWPDKRRGNLYFEMSDQQKNAARASHNEGLSVQAWPLISADAVRSFVIPASDKSQIRQELEEMFDYREPALFADMQRFSAVNSPRLPMPHIEDPEFSLLLGNQCYLQGDYPGAITHYDKSIELAPDAESGYFYYVRGNAKAADGDLGEALQDYDSGIRCEEGPSGDRERNSEGNTTGGYLWRLYYNRGNVKAELKDLKGALRDYEKAIRICRQVGARESVSYVNKGNVNYLLNRYGDAIRDYDQASKAGDPFAQFKKGNMLVILGRFDEALACYDGAIRNGDNRSGVICNRNGVAAILNRIGGDGYVVRSPRFKDSTQRLIIEVSLRADADNRLTEFFNFHGMKGNIGNAGAQHLPGGKGYRGIPGFVVVVKGEEW
ncbi:MAG: tetratricopeptide repeat protein [Caldilineaceae bacterium SB0665_bin_25]|nr:tetratricopeptide repeat protein [Caldilineaceae bacterium SB0665_bin_25]